MVFYKKRNYKRKRNYRKKGGYKKRYVNKNRLIVPRIPRPLQLKSRSAVQKLVYYNTFHAIPGLSNAPLTQQNFFFRIQLNSPWIFPYQWDQYASSANQILTSNETIVASDSSHNPTATTTSMPGFQDGFDLFSQYSKGIITGTKVTLSAYPTENLTDNQPGLLYAIRHSQRNSGLGLTSTVNELNNLPFRQQKTLTGAMAATSGFGVNNIVGSRIVVNHSPKKFNNVVDLRDNKDFYFSTAALGSHPTEGDYLTIGIMPSINSYSNGGTITARKATNCMIKMRIEQSVLWTEPLENLTNGSGNYSFPRRAATAGVFGALGALAYRRRPYM